MALLTATATPPGHVSQNPVRGPVLLIVNPASRRGGALRNEAARAFARAGVECEIAETAGMGDAAHIARDRHEHFDAVFTLGGDGTAMEVVGALAGGRQRVGILPGGTGNLMARTLGIPRRMHSAVPMLLYGDEVRVDLGRLDDGRRFAFAAGVGVDARMIAHTSRRWKRRLGVLAYAISAGREVLGRTSFDVRATVDGRLYERRATAVMVANFGSVLGRLITLGPGIRQDDGVLDLCIFSPATAGEALRVVWRLARRDFRPAPYLLWVPGRELRVETFPPQLAQADGELLGTVDLHMVVEPLAARLLVPGPRGMPRGVGDRASFHPS